MGLDWISVCLRLVSRRNIAFLVHCVCALYYRFYHIIGTEIMIIVLAVSLQVDGGWLSIETSLTSLLISFAWQS